MRAIIEDDYIIAIGEHVAGDEISDEYAAQIMMALEDRLEPEEGYGWRLRADTLTWERYEIPPASVPPEEDNLWREE